MRLLLDTHAFIWAVGDRVDRLSPTARAAITDRSHQLLVSAASAWEIAAKHRLGRLEAGDRLVAQWADVVGALGADELAVSAQHALLAGRFPGGHRDPFDRMLSAQAIIEGARLVTADRAVATLGASVLW